MPWSLEASWAAHEEQDLDRRVAAWGGLASVRERFVARQRASASLVLVLERFPNDLRTWLRGRLSASDEGLDDDLRMVERELLHATSFMTARGLLHLDAHFENILTDGRRLYLSDFGQALGIDFALTPAETEFFGRHGDFDRSYVMAVLVKLVRDLPAGAAIASRYGAIAAVVGEFFQKLRIEASTAQYPAEELARAWAAVTT